MMTWERISPSENKKSCHPAHRMDVDCLLSALNKCLRVNGCIEG
jgi:hypothetical protein